MAKAISNKFFNSNANLGFFLTGTFIGSALTYFLDPDRGAYRRHLIRDKGIHYQRKAMKYGGKFYRNMRNRSEGLLARTNQLLSEAGEVPNEILEARVRSNFGRVVSHPKSITVTAIDGTVFLSGNILEAEYDDLIECVSETRGVDEIRDELSVHESAEHIPDLQGEGPEYLRRD